MSERKEDKWGLIHAIAQCQDCKWEDTWYLTAVNKGREHAQKTMHTVIVETTHSKTYNPKESE